MANDYKIEGKERTKDLELAKRLVILMDDAFEIPLINKRVGLDAIIGLVPGLGDIVSFIVSVFIIFFLIKHGAPFKLILKMVFNIVIDLMVGSIPILGDIWDIFFRANRKNLKLLIDHHS